LFIRYSLLLQYYAEFAGDTKYSIPYLLIIFTYFAALPFGFGAVDNFDFPLAIAGLGALVSSGWTLAGSMAFLVALVLAAG